MRTTLDQKMTEEIVYLPDATIQGYHAEYILQMESSPKPDIHPNPEQLAALAYVITINRAPYAEFSVFGKFGVRTQRRISHTGLIQLPNGLFK